MSNLEHFIIKSFTAPNWFIYLIAICIPIIILGIISEIFKISEEKPKINFIFNISCIVLPLLAVLVTYYIKPQYNNLESLNQHYKILITEGDGKILLKYDLKETKTFLSDNKTMIIRKENEKYYAKIGNKETETTLNEIKDVVRKSKNKQIEEKLTLKDLGDDYDK